MNILIVEDNDDVRRTLAEVLTQEGHVVTSAVSGRQALDYLLKVQYDAVITDLVLPAMDGSQLLEEIRKHPAPPPVVVLSGVEELPEVAPPVAAVFRKPADPEALLRTLRGLTGAAP